MILIVWLIESLTRQFRWIWWRDVGVSQTSSAQKSSPHDERISSISSQEIQLHRETNGSHKKRPYFPIYQCFSFKVVPSDLSMFSLCQSASYYRWIVFRNRSCPVCQLVSEMSRELWLWKRHLFQVYPRSFWACRQSRPNHLKCRIYVELEQSWTDLRQCMLLYFPSSLPEAMACMVHAGEEVIYIMQSYEDFWNISHGRFIRSHCKKSGVLCVYAGAPLHTSVSLMFSTRARESVLGKLGSKSSELTAQKATSVFDEVANPSAWPLRT